MKTFLPFVLSIFIPGAGQILLKDYLKGITMIIISLILGIFIPFIPFEFFFIGTMIWSIVDIFIKTEKISGKTKAIRYLIFSIVIMVVLIPAVFYLTAISFIRGGEYVQDEFLNSKYTKSEMVKIANELDNYLQFNGKYPSNYQKFVSSKPIWNSWKTDNWKNKYNYTLVDSANFILSSSGKDGEFGTDDDIIKTN